MSDFAGNMEAVHIVATSPLDVYAHNLETVRVKRMRHTNALNDRCRFVPQTIDFLDRLSVILP